MLRACSRLGREWRGPVPHPGCRDPSPNGTVACFAWVPDVDTDGLPAYPLEAQELSHVSVPPGPLRWECGL